MHIKIELTNHATGIVTISIKILEVDFGNSILNNSKWDEPSDSIAKKSISARLSLRGKKIITNNQTKPT